MKNKVYFNYLTMIFQLKKIDNFDAHWDEKLAINLEYMWIMPWTDVSSISFVLLDGLPAHRKPR